MSENQKQIVVVLGAVRDEGKQVLVARRVDTAVPDAFGKWEFVGGAVDFGEDPETALVREVAEESGLVVRIVRLLPKIFTHIWRTKSGESIHVLLVTYECAVVSGQLNNNRVADEIGDLQFVSPEVLKKMDTLPNVKETLKYL